MNENFVRNGKKLLLINNTYIILYIHYISYKETNNFVAHICIIYYICIGISISNWFHYPKVQQNCNSFPTNDYYHIMLANVTYLIPIS